MKKSLTLVALALTLVFSSGFGIAENNNVVKKELVHKTSSVSTDKSILPVAKAISAAPENKEAEEDSRSIVQSIGGFLKNAVSMALTSVVQLLKSFFM